MSSERRKKFLCFFSLLFLVSLFPIGRGCGGGKEKPKEKKILSCAQDCAVELTSTTPPDFSQCYRGPCKTAEYKCGRHRRPSSNQLDWKRTKRQVNEPNEAKMTLKEASGSGLTQDGLTNVTRETPSLASLLAKSDLVKSRKDSLDMTGTSGARRRKEEKKMARFLSHQQKGVWTEKPLHPEEARKIEEEKESKSHVWRLFCASTSYYSNPPDWFMCDETDYCNQNELTERHREFTSDLIANGKLEQQKEIERKKEYDWEQKHERKSEQRERSREWGQFKREQWAERQRERKTREEEREKLTSPYEHDPHENTWNFK